MKAGEYTFSRRRIFAVDCKGGRARFLDTIRRGEGLCGRVTREKHAISQVFASRPTFHGFPDRVLKPFDLSSLDAFKLSFSLFYLFENIFIKF